MTTKRKVEIFSAGCPACEVVVLDMKKIEVAKRAKALLAFALGRAIPIAFGTSVIGWAERFPAMERYQRWLDIGGGVLLILAGFYLLNAYFFWIPALAA